MKRLVSAFFVSLLPMSLFFYGCGDKALDRDQAIIAAEEQNLEERNKNGTAPNTLKQFSGVLSSCVTNYLRSADVRGCWDSSYSSLSQYDRKWSIWARAGTLCHNDSGLYLTRKCDQEYAVGSCVVNVDVTDGKIIQTHYLTSASQAEAIEECRLKGGEYSSLEAEALRRQEAREQQRQEQQRRDQQRQEQQRQEQQRQDQQRQERQRQEQQRQDQQRQERQRQEQQSQEQRRQERERQEQQRQDEDRRREQSTPSGAKRALCIALGLDPATATPEQIRTGYRRESRRLHPDRNHSPSATEEMQNLNNLNDNYHRFFP